MASHSSDSWFAVDRGGLGDVLERRGKEFAVFELVQNALDENTTAVEVALEPIKGEEHLAWLTVTDDNPHGFADLTHAYTLFAQSAKKGDPTKRGRFNLGEKLVLALCEQAAIHTTTGTVHFLPDGRREFSGADKRARGSQFKGLLRLNTEEQGVVAKKMQSLIPPPGVRVTFNGLLIAEREPRHVLTCTLPTEVSDSEGRLRRLRRQTEVRLYEPEPWEDAMLYEMGLPVVETFDRWHYDVGQKIPLSMERDNVDPRWLRELRTYVLNHTAAADTVTADDANATWGRDAVADPRVSEEAVRASVAARFGEKVVAYDMHDREANKVAVSEGFTVVHGSQLSKPEWENLRRFEVLKPAGQVTPSNAFEVAELGGVDPLPRSGWTDDMWVVVRYAEQVARELVGGDVDVRFVDNPGSKALASYGGRLLTFNLAHLGRDWPSRMVGPNLLHPDLDALLIHELAHHFNEDHLSRGYYDTLCNLGARLKALAVSRPDIASGQVARALTVS